jgi:tetratricopeptide (TPR) repeat protein
MIQSLRAAAIVAVAIAFIPNVHAEDKEKAREAYRAATQHYDFGEYQQALDGFKEAYKNYEDPAFLYNIAQCHRALGYKQEAITFYKSYLRNSADAPNRDEVQKTIADLQSAIDREKRALAPADANLTTSPSTAAAPIAAPSNQEFPATGSTSPLEKRPPRRAWIWGVVAGVVAVGVAVGVGVGLGTQPHAPKATYGTVSF